MSLSKLVLAAERGEDLKDLAIESTVLVASAERNNTTNPLLLQMGIIFALCAVIERLDKLSENR